MGLEHTYLRGIDPTILTGLRYKWDLSAQDDFLAWNAELSSVILSACPEARAPFVRYRSLTLSAVQLLTGAPPVSSTDTMELLSGTAKANNPNLV
jgi:hypothetical protein